MPQPIHVTFVGGAEGAWMVDRTTAIAGASLDSVVRVQMIESPAPLSTTNTWSLRGVTSNERYVEVCCVDPVTKSAACWDLTQDERRRVFETDSHQRSSTC